MEKLTIDTTDVSDDDFNYVEAVLRGALTALGKIRGVKVGVEDDDEAVKVTSRGK